MRGAKTIFVYDIHDTTGKTKINHDPVDKGTLFFGEEGGLQFIRINIFHRQGGIFSNIEKQREN